MNKIILLISAVVILLSLYFFQNYNLKNDDHRKINLGSCTFNIETVDDDISRAKGLSDRDRLCDDCGMLFVFPQAGKYGFWMKDMRFPLDMLWVMKDEVVEIRENIAQDSRETLTPSVSADKVLEINAKDIKRCNIKVGDKLK